MSAVELALVFGRARPGVFLFAILIPLAIVALIAYGIWELSRSRAIAPATGVAAPAAAGSARAVLDDRFARGEIDAEEYVQRRALLDGTPLVTPAPPVAAPPAPPGTAPAGSAVVDEVVATGEQPVVPEDPSSGPVAG